ncbi:MAG: ferrous iron transporter B [Gammaproteobacteria bacterium]|nr:ferrous iron transporter B [Gammaproteobacteria bacterium]
MSKIVLIGSPNSGKSLLFNRLTGLHQKVANFPGITVDVSSGSLQSLPEITLVDFPGTYSLQPISGDEQVAVKFFTQALDDPNVTQVLCLIDVTRLEKSLYFTLQVIRESARHGKHVTVLANMMDVLEKHHIQVDLAGLSAQIKAPVLPVSARTGSGIDALLARLKANQLQPRSKAAAALTDTPDELLRGTALQLARRFGPKGDILIKSQARLDDFFLHTTLGGLAFFGIMYLLFQSIFTWAAPAMDAVEALLGALSNIVVPAIPNQMARDFTADAIFSGIGAFLVFVPQIFVLTFIIGILEDSGYMARAALICHKPLRLFGLTGKSFIPMLSGVACAIPGIYAARSIDSPKKRLLTYMAIPLMPCSARLPVYTLLIAAFIPQTTALGGLVGMQGLAMFLIYFFGMACGLLVTGLVSRFREDHFTDLPFVLEMPPYRMPAWQPLLRNAWNRSKHFVTKAGKIIFGVTVIIWVLGYFPNGGADLNASWLGHLGHVVEPIFAPLGLDWRYGVAVLTSFLAREVFVGTLGTMFGIEGAEENMVPLVAQIQASGLSVGSGLALLVFFAIALMCVSTLAILSREAQSTKLAVNLFAAYGVLAYGLAILVYNLAGLVGV